MSKFFSAYSSESDSESSDNEEVQKPRVAPATGRGFQFSDEEDDTKRIVRSQKDKRYDELQTSIKQMRNSMKIKDIAKVQTEWENLCKVYVKSKNVVDKEGIPHFYIKSLTELEDFIKDQWENTEGRKKLSKVNAKALASVRQKLRKYNREFEDQISDCRVNPDKYEEEEVDEEEDEEDKVESEDDELPTPAESKSNKFLKSTGLDSDSDDSFDMGEDSSGSDDDDDLPAGGVLTAEMFLKKTDKDQKVGKKAGKQAEKILATKQRAKVQLDDDEGGWTEVKGSVLQDKARQLFPKDTEINHQVVLKKMQEILAQRGKKSTDRAYLIDYFKELRTIADKHNLGPAMSLKIIFSIIAAIFDSTSSTDASLKYEIWQSCLEHVTEMMSLLEDNPDIYVNPNVNDDSENVENAEEPLRIKGCVLGILEKMNDEFTKLLQHSDCHSTEYVDRLKDELIVTDIIERLQAKLEKTGISDEISRVYMLRVEHIYYKLDTKDLQCIKAQMEENETKGKKVEEEQKEETPVEDTTTEEKPPVENGVTDEKEPETIVDGNECATEDDVKSATGDDAAVIDKLCKYIYAKAPDRIRTRAMLCHIYHHALHDRWYEARDMILISHLQETIQHSDIATQILYNRTMVQLGLCAFRHGMINDAHNALHDLQATGRAKELLAQGLMNLKNTERTPEQEKIEKRRLMPFHMHINLELLECVYLTSAMLMEIPYMAAHEFDHRRKIISKSFHYQMRQSDKQPLVGPPESMREHVVAAAKAMKTGDWKQCSGFILAIKCWNLFNKSGDVKTMLERKIKEESLRTYLFTYNKIYDSISMLGLAEMFDLPPPVVHSIISKMIINEELQASWDEPTQTLVLHHDAEPTLLQSMGMQLAEKIGNLVDHHERILDFKQGGFFTKGSKGQYQQGGKGQYQQGGKGNYQGNKGQYQQGGKGNYQGNKGNYQQGGKRNYQGGRQYQQVRFTPQH